MKFCFAILATIVGAEAFTSPIQTSRVSRTVVREGIAEELDLPCEDECALKSFPNLPESVHPGVLSGQAMQDLLNHAKENGEVLSDHHNSAVVGLTHLAFFNRKICLALNLHVHLIPTRFQAMPFLLSTVFHLRQLMPASKLPEKTMLRLLFNSPLEVHR
jgi:hypothetical protein